MSTQTLLFRLGVSGILFAMTALSAFAQETGGRQRSKVPKGRRVYLGRPIAQTMHFTGASWLLRESREKEEACARMLTELKLKSGMSVCDLGCGNGFYSLKMAETVGKRGQVLAVDIQPEMLVMLRERCEKDGIENISPILGSLHDPRLPPESVDLILLVDVYHEFSHPVYMLKAMHNALKKDGRIALLEYRAEDPKVPIKPLHKMSKAQAIKEFAANGFKLSSEFDGLPWQHMLFFSKADQ
jgi:cyclopropane fatty-acyl-phospholipid synthase-like methyltransferase